MNENDLTAGKILPVLLKFALPVILSMAATQFYSMADAIIVGRLLDKDALAAVSNAANVLSVFLIVSGGMELGGSLIVSNHRLTSSKKEFDAIVWNLLFIDLVTAALMLVLGYLLQRSLLALTNTPASIMGGAMLYGNIYLIGLPFLMLYDLSKQIMIGCGDSRTPFILILITSGMNIVLDLIMVKLWGIAGAAIATVLAQILGCLVCLYLLRKRILASSFSLSLLDQRWVKEISGIAPAYMIQQGAIILLALFRQTLLGGLGTAAIAGFSSATRVTQLLSIPVGGMCQALTVFIAQNLSIGKKERADHSVKEAYKIFAFWFLFTSILFIFAARPFMTMFTNDAYTIRYGALILRFWPFAFVFYGSQNFMEAVMRGNTEMKRYLFSSISTMIVLMLSAVLLVRIFAFNGFWISSIAGYLYGAFVSFLLVRNMHAGKRNA